MKPFTFLIAVLLTSSILMWLIYKFFIGRGAALFLIGFAIWILYMAAIGPLHRRVFPKKEKPEVKEMTDDDFDF